GHIIRHQSELGITGHIAEVGTFEGRFFIALALGLSDGEHALGIDTFDWPDAGLYDRFIAHCDRLGLARERYTALKASTRNLVPRDIAEKLGGQQPASQASDQKVRFWHIDGDHARSSLLIDLDLAYATMHPKGVLCLDDMLHPG